MNIYGYGCVASPHKNIDVSKTKAYKELVQIFGGNKGIYIDLIPRADKPRPVFEDLLTNVLKPHDVLVLNNINALGNTGKLAVYNYRRLLIQDNLVLIPTDFNEDKPNEYSTADVKGNALLSFAEREEMLSKLASIDKLKNNQGMAKNTVSTRFTNVYWPYECFRISDDTACAYLGISLNTFRVLCKNYETDGQYREEYFREQAHYEEEYQISKLPKRFGAVPKGFDKLIEMVETTQTPVEAASEKLGLPYMDSTLYKRFYLKQIGGKKILSQSAWNNLDKKLTNKLLKEVKTDD